MIAWVPHHFAAFACDALHAETQLPVGAVEFLKTLRQPPDRVVINVVVIFGNNS